MRHCLLTLALGGDLFSKFISYSDDPDFIASGQLLLSFDFLWTNTGATTWAGTDHQTSGFGDEQWRWNSAGGALHGTNPPANTWVHVAFRFKPEDSGNVGSIVLKFEQNSGTAGTSYFDNIRLAAGAGAVLTGVALARNHVPEFDKIFVANAGSGMVNVYDGKTYTRFARVSCSARNPTRTTCGGMKPPNEFLSASWAASP